MSSGSRQIAVLPGDGIGPEVTQEAVYLLEEIGRLYGHQFRFEYGKIGGIAIDEEGTPLPEATLKLCRESEAVLLGAVGGPKWDRNPAHLRPEAGLLGLRKALGLYANLRPITVFSSLRDSSTLKPEVLEGVDLIFVRELTGGLYFGTPRERRQGENGPEVVDTLLYTEAEIERILRLGFAIAAKRRGKLTSVDKANVLESSRVWRETAERLKTEYPSVELSHMLVDNCAMQLVRNPAQFDVVVTENLFGDILSDESAMITGSIGMLPSASLSSEGPGLYEPIHGSAPDIAGLQKANPLATFLSAAMLLRHSLGLEREAAAVEQAVQRVLDAGARTGDIAQAGEQVIGTAEMGERVRSELQQVALQEIPKTGKTMFEKIWERHAVVEEEGKPSLLYIDLHLVHEVTSPQAFEGLRLAGRKVRRPDLTYATMDHNVPTDNPFVVNDWVAAKQIETLVENCREFGVTLADLHSEEQGIVHVIGPELGLTQPGKTIVCGDSHTSTHGAFGALAFGIGTSEVEHVLATQCLWQTRPKTLRVRLEGQRHPGVTAKDVVLGLIAKHGISFGTGYVIEFAGEAVRQMSMEERMTVCNMSIEGGARAGLMQPDETTFAYLHNRRYAPQGEEFEARVQEWRALASDEDAVFDQEIVFDVSALEPQVTWGTNPGMGTGVRGTVPDPDSFENEVDRRAAKQALDYMGLTPGTRIVDIPVQHVFIGSCTNSRIEDLRAAAEVARGQRVAAGVRALVVPGSKQVKQQAEREGLHEVFLAAGFEWREPGCSMCLAMNNDVIPEGERCASTSNRNFEGRQGRGARTHLVSPATAAATAIAGHFVDVAELLDPSKKEASTHGTVHSS